MDHISDAELRKESLKRFAVIVMISRQEMEEAMGVFMTNAEWEDVKCQLNTAFYELICDDVEEFSYTLLREIRIRSQQNEPCNRWHSV
jgi:hypothetical protein